MKLDRKLRELKLCLDDYAEGEASMDEVSRAVRAVSVLLPRRERNVTYIEHDDIVGLLDRLRRKAGSVRQVCIDLDCTAMTFYKWMNSGRVTPRWSRPLKKACEHYGVKW